ncbi:MAG: hypothetical protein KOO65_08640 [Desulfobacterales bacterium]|nr:hypothetical protein [Desulfobacterales bacterium]
MGEEEAMGEVGRLKDSLEEHLILTFDYEDGVDQIDNRNEKIECDFLHCICPVEGYEHFTCSEIEINTVMTGDVSEYNGEVCRKLEVIAMFENIFHDERALELSTTYLEFKNMEENDYE